MSRDEYVHWSECRQASFTYRKSKRFREWTHMSSLTESRPSDDIVDILGFLTFEIVASITEEALKVRAQEAIEDDQEGRARKRTKAETHTKTLFDGPDEGRTSLEVRHVEEAFRRLQANSPRCSAMRMFSGTKIARRATLI